MLKVLGGVAAAASIFFAAKLPAQTAQVTTAVAPSLLSDGNPTVSIQFADGRSLPLRSRDGRYPLVLASFGQTLTVTARIPVALASLLVFQPLDGGIFSAQSPLAADGTTVFHFQPGTQPGLYRVLVILGSHSAALQFWVPNPAGENPPALTPEGALP